MFFEQVMNSYYWIIFNAFILGMLMLDLLVFNRKNHVVKVKEALLWSAFWIMLALIFNLGIFYFMGPSYGLEFLTGYLVEKSLSVDNLFVFLMVFSYFKVPEKYQHKVLFWGVLGALVFRAIFILAGISLIENFHFAIYILGGFLVFGGIKMIFQKEVKLVPDNNIVIRIARLFLPVLKDFHGSSFFVIRKSVIYATPLFIVLIVIETTDIVFALDSIPAILAISTHPFIVYSSNIFAILGLRSLFFALSGVMQLFHYLKFGLSIILVFVGLKILIMDFYIINVVFSLLFIATVLLISVVASILIPQKVEMETAK
ncbi:TerC family protein [soil metagenome]